MTSRSRPEAVRSRAAAVDEVEGHVVSGAVEQLRVELERRALVLDLEVLHQLNTQTNTSIAYFTRDMAHVLSQVIKL